VSRRDLGSAVVAAVATLLGSLALLPVFSSSAWLLPVFAAVVVVLAGGVLLRTAGPAVWAALTGGRPVPGTASGVGVVLVPVGQLVLLACLLTALYAPARAVAGVLPTRASLLQLAGVLTDGMAEMREQATPALALTGLLALTTLFIGLVAVVADVVAVAARQAALGGIGLLVLASVPVTTTVGAIGLVALAAPAAAFALLLWADQHRRLPARGRPAGTVLGTGVVAAVQTGVAALLAGLVIGALVPTLREGSLATGLGGGTGSSTGTSLDPVAALRGQLTLPEPIPLFRLDASVSDPGYLRAVALDQYDAETGWSMSNLDGETSIAEDDRLAPLPLEQLGRPVRASVRVLQHDDRFLPLPFSPLSVRLEDADPDDWRFDPATGTVFGRNVSTGDLRYTVSAVEPRPSPDLLASVSPLLPFDEVQERFTLLPELDPSVTDLVASLTGDAGAPYERVRRIHDYLTNRSNGFIYSLSTEPGTSGDDLVDFLRLKRGYCEQYAGTMAVMVRAAGVPARVALGYTPGSTEREGTRLVTSDDAHAWVEVYFDELGWVPFDPTPIAAGRAVDLAWAPRAGTQDSAESAGAPAPTAPSPATAAPREDRAAEAVPTAPSDRATSDVLRPLLAGAGIALLGAALLAAPAGIRTLQRRRRVAEGTAGALWDELTASARDLGVPLHPARTPRQTAGELLARLPKAGAPAGAPATDAVHLLARAEEMASYGRDGGAGAVHPDAVPALRTVRRTLLRSASRRNRMLARWWPASLMAGAAGRLAGQVRERLAALRPVRRAGRTGRSAPRRTA
jgi:transglutaminase-like putative cysteine protease